MKQLGWALKQNFLLLLIGISVIATVAGCGGSGGNNASSVMSDNVTRQIQPGDSLTYSVTGLAEVARKNYTVSGTATVKTYAEARTPVYGTRALEQKTECNITVNGQSVLLTSVDHIEQDINGNIYCVGYQRGTRIETLEDITRKPLVYPGSCSNRMYWDYDATLRGAEYYYAHIFVHISDQQSVAGYRAYEVGTAEFCGDQVMRQEGSWFVPELGYPVQLSTDVMQNDDVYMLTMTLTEKNF